MKKLIDFKHLWQAIQHYADNNYEGNFSLAARKLIEKGLIASQPNKKAKDDAKAM